MASTCANTVKCSRCHRIGHLARECKYLPFTRTTTVAEQRQQQQMHAAAKKAEWEAKQDEWEAKRNEWLAKMAEREAKQAKSSTNRPRRLVKQVDWDAKSDASQATASTVATESLCSQEMRSQAAAEAAKNKEVLKLKKK